MAHYTELFEREIKEITDQYRLEITSYAPIKQGQGNSNYLVHTIQGKYILTIFEIDRRKVLNVCSVLPLLEKHTYPAPRIKELANGDLLTDYQGKPVMIKAFITGQVLNDLDYDQTNQLGRALARLHEITPPDGLPDQHGYMVKEFPQVLEKGIDKAYINWLEHRYSYLTQNLPPGLPSGLIHGDLFFDNALFEGKKFKAILDFEDVCHYFKAFDIGMAIVGLCKENENINLGKTRAFVNGYQEFRLLESGERVYLQAFIEFAAILTSAWRYWKYNIDMPVSQKSNKFLEMASIAKDIAGIPKNHFINTVFG